jgi:DNA-binding MarR family transcriptional regulator
MSAALRRTNARPKAPSGRGGNAPLELDATLSFMRTLWGLHHELRLGSKRMQTRFGLTGPQRLVVRIIGHLPGASAGSVSAALNLHPSTLTEILKELERRGLVKRRAHSDDRRRAILVLTPKGRRIDRLQTGTVEASVREAMRSLPHRKIKTTEEVLAALTRQLASDHEDG